MALTRPKLSHNIDTDSSVFTDPILVLHQSATAANVDSGFLFNRANGLVSNVAIYWSESANSFVTAFTTNAGSTNSNISVSTYANLRTGILTSNSITNSGTLVIGNTGDVSSNIGAFYTYANATFATQAGTTSTIDANLGAFYSYANTKIGSNSNGNLVVAALTQSTSTTTGALVVGGGAAVGGNLYVGGNLIVSNVVYQNSEVITTTELVQGNIVAASSAVSTSTTTGALVVIGGAGIGGALYITNTGDVSANIGAYQTYANANVTAIQANLGAYQTYANANVVAIQANLGAYQTYANANVVVIQANLGAYQTYANANVVAIQANIGAYQTYANANVVAIQANLGAFQVFSNANAATQAISINSIVTNANANTAAYLLTATGNINAGNITTSGTSGNISGVNYIFASNYVYANGVSIFSGTYSNTNVEAYIGGNIGAFQIFSNANAATQATSINTINANIGAYQTYANANVVVIQANLGAYQTYSNANVAAIQANIGAFYNYANTKIGTNTDSNLVINSTTESYGTTSGALVVKGGAGIAGNLWVAGNIYASNLISIASSTLSVQDPLLYLTASNPSPYNYDIGFFSHFVGGSYNNYQHTGFSRDVNTNTWTLFSNVFAEPGTTINWTEANIIFDPIKIGSANIANTTVSTSTTTGALVVGGGAGIAGALYIANTGDVSANIGTLFLGNAGTQANLGAFYNYANTKIGTNTNGNLVINATTSSTNTTTGALVVKGGAGIAGAVNIGTSLAVDGGVYGNVVTTQFASVFGRAVGPNATSLMQVKANDGTTGMGMRVVTGSTTLIYSSGAIDFSTGVTVRDQDVPTGVAAGTGVQIAANGAIIALTGIASTTTGTGAVIVTGGVGVSGALNVGGNVSAAGINVNDRIDWTGTTYAPPTFTTRSAGQKITLYPSISGSTVDYALGINGGVLWSAIPAATADYSFKWYGGETELASLFGAGNLTVISANIASTNTATSKTTGALIVSGGAGIAGNVYADKFYTTNGLYWASNGLAFSSGLTISEIDSANALSNISNSVTSIRFDRDTGFSVVELDPGNVKVSLGSSFKTWHVPGQADLVAVAEDEVTFFGNSIDITTNPTAPKSITFATNLAAYTGNITAGNITSSGNIRTDKLYTTSGLFWSGNGVSINVSTLNDLSDVVIDTPLTNHVLKYDGAKWVNGTSPGGGGGGGITYTAGVAPPGSPATGDQWYDTVNDVLYEYLDDGVSQYWVDVQSQGQVGNIISVSDATLSGNIVVGVNNRYSIGASSGYLKNIYANTIVGNITTIGNLTVGNANITTLTSTTVNAGNLIVTSGDITPTSNLTQNIGSVTNWWNTIYGISTQARYADLAERYRADAEYPSGTVVVFGGEYEITISTKEYDPAVAGVISSDPAYLMNAAAEGLPVALQGRVPCQVQGPIRKGELVVSSSVPGVAQRFIKEHFEHGCIIGKSLENINDDTIKTIEVVVGRY